MPRLQADEKMTLVTVQLCAALALSQAQPLQLDPPPAPATAMSQSPHWLRSTLAITAASATVVGSGFASYYVGRAWPQARYDLLGRPVPLAVAGGFAIAMLSNVLLTQWLVPECMRIADDAVMQGDIWKARREGFRWSRWPALASLLSVGLIVAGSAMEGGGFGNGQGVWAAGFFGFLASWLTYGVLEVVGTYRGYVDSRREPQKVKVW